MSTIASVKANGSLGMGIIRTKLVRARYKTGKVHEGWCCRNLSVAIDHIPTSVMFWYVVSIFMEEGLSDFRCL